MCAGLPPVHILNQNAANSEILIPKNRRTL